MNRGRIALASLAVLVVAGLLPSGVAVPGNSDSGYQGNPARMSRIDVTDLAYNWLFFSWEDNHEQYCWDCPDVIQTGIVAPADYASLTNARECQVLVWTGSPPAVDTEPVLGVVYVDERCIIEWGFQAN